VAGNTVWGLVAATFVAAFVEWVEALTIVLAMGLTRGWRSALAGTATALVALAGFTAVVDATAAYVGAEPSALAVSGNDFHPNADGHARIAHTLDANPAWQPNTRDDSNPVITRPPDVRNTRTAWSC